MEHSENPNEETTLLAKHRRNMESTTTTNRLFTERNTSYTEFQWTWQSIRFYLVEIMVLILVFAYNLSATVLKNQIIFQTCTVIFDYNTTDCSKLSTKDTSDYIKNIEEEIQPYAARVFMITTVIESIVPAFCGSFVGAWSDRFGRKPLLIASFTGYFLFYCVTSLISHISDSVSVSPWYYLLPSLPLSLLGDGVTYSVATLCYISDVSTVKERPYRMTFYEAVMYIGLMTGSFASGVLYENYKSATLIFSISAFCIMLATLIIIFAIPESLNTRLVPIVPNGETDASSRDQQEQNSQNLFDIKHFREMYRTCFKPRELELRSVLLLIIASLITSAFVLEGSVGVFYLFIREKFKWTVKEYTTYETISIFVPLLGNIVGIWLLRKVFKMKLLNVALVGLLSHTCNSLMKGFAAINWQLYLAIVLGVLKSIVNPMLRTVLSSLVPANELGTIMKNEVIYQACTTIFQYNESDCLQLGTKNVSGYLQEIETEVQPYVANLFMIRTLLESIVPALCGVFIGSWSDHYGRKPLLLVSMIGFSCTYVIAAIICELSQYYPVNPWYYILAVIPHSVLGGNCVFSVAAFCFISDVTDTKTRPYRMISLEAFLSIGLMVGSLLSSFVYAATNATITFSISGILMCIATAYIALCVPESLNLRPTDGESKPTQVNCSEIPMNCTTLTKTSTGDDKKIKNTILEDDKFHEIDLTKTEEKPPVLENAKAEKNNENEVTKTAGLFSYIHVKEMWFTCFKARPFKDRSIILLVTGSMFLAIFVLDGAMTVFYLFVREKFQWTVREFTFYETISHVTSMFGALVGFLIMRKVFSFSVVTLALIAFFSDILRSIIQGLATEPWHLYLAIAAGALKAVGGPMCRTIVSNIVPPTDLGKIFSIKNILQSIAPFLAAPLYTVIYQSSLTSFPGLFNVISAIIYLIGFIFILFVLRFKLNYKDHYNKILK